MLCFNSLQPEQNGPHFDNIFKYIFVNDNYGIEIRCNQKPLEFETKSSALQVIL